MSDSDWSRGTKAFMRAVRHAFFTYVADGVFGRAMLLKLLQRVWYQVSRRRQPNAIDARWFRIDYEG